MKNLLKKLVVITSEIKGLEKNGTNQQQKYSFVAGQDAMKKFRELEVAHNIKVIPVVRESSLKVIEKQTEKGSGFLTTAIVDFTIYDLDSDDNVTVSIASQGYDTTDKSVFKLATGAFKYFLLQTFSYSTDDPEDDSRDTAVQSTPRTTTQQTQITPETTPRATQSAQVAQTVPHAILPSPTDRTRVKTPSTTPTPTPISSPVKASFTPSKFAGKLTKPITPNGSAE